MSSERLDGISRFWLAMAYLLVMGFLITGTALCWDYFVLEHGRTEPWKALLCLTADLSAFIWFNGFFWRHAVRGIAFRAMPWEDFVRSRGPWSVLAGTLGAIAIDGFATYNLRLEDQERFEHRIVANGTVNRIVPGPYEYRKMWELFGDFRAIDGQRYPFRFRVEGFIFRDKLKMEEGLPPEFGKGISEGKIPFVVPVAYDPEWPARNWIDGMPWTDANRNWYVGYMFLIAQSLGIIFTLVMLKDGYDKRELRSWWECAWIVPLLFQALIVFGIGMDYRSKGLMHLS